jgi:signal transduction histidine kinase
VWPFTADASAPPADARPAGAPGPERPAADAGRLAALRATALLDTPADAAFDRLSRLAARLLGAPIALVTLVDEDRQFFKSCIGLPEPWASLRETPLSHSFCQHVVEAAAPLVIEDAREHPLVRDNLAIRDLGVIAYLGIPLATADGVVLGSFCAIDGRPRRWSADDVATLGELAAAVMTEVELRTALRRAEEARAEASAATRAKDDCLAFVSHELRTPLTGIAFNAQLLAMGRCGPLDERQARAVDRIERSQQHLLALTNQLLDFRAAASGQVEYALARVAVADAVGDALGLVGAQLDEAGLRTECPPPAPGLAVLADGPKLRQVLVNLLGNAARYTPPGGAVCVDAAADGARVRLRVRDTGLGIAADQLERIFEPFARVRDGRLAPPQGTGLGLTISRALARGMGGDVTVESAPGAGSTFAVELPRA